MASLDVLHKVVGLGDRQGMINTFFFQLLFNILAHALHSAHTIQGAGVSVQNMLACMK